jgi:hypothetical protein
VPTIQVVDAGGGVEARPQAVFVVRHERIEILHRATVMEESDPVGFADDRARGVDRERPDPRKPSRLTGC